MRDKLQALVTEMVGRGIRLEDALREFETLFIARALESSDGTLAEVATRLGIHRNTLARKMSEYRLQAPRH